MSDVAHTYDPAFTGVLGFDQAALCSSSYRYLETLITNLADQQPMAGSERWRGSGEDFLRRKPGQHPARLPKDKGEARSGANAERGGNEPAGAGSKGFCAHGGGPQPEPGGNGALGSTATPLIATSAWTTGVPEAQAGFPHPAGPREPHRPHSWIYQCEGAVC